MTPCSTYDPSNQDCFVPVAGIVDPVDMRVGGLATLIGRFCWRLSVAAGINNQSLVLIYGTA
jgi:hypothetical protein